MKQSLFRTIRAVIWLIPIFFVSWILMKNLAPSGSARIFVHQGRSNAVVRGFDKEAVFGPVFKEQGKAWRSVLSDRATFTVSPWRPFRDIELTLDLLRPTTRVTLKAQERPNTVLGPTTLFLPEIEGYRDWSVLQEDGRLLLQREKHFSSITDFIANLPPAKEVSTFGLNLGKHPDQPSNAPEGINKIRQSLRGSHWIRLTVTEENPKIQMTVEKYDLNELTGPDRLTAFVYGPDRIVKFARTIEDDGNASDDRVPGALQSIEVALSDLPAGEYQVALLANEEVVIKSIETTNQFGYLESQVRLFADVDHPATLAAFGQVLEVTNRSDNDESLTINGQEYRVPAKSNFRQFSDADLNTVTVRSSQLVLRSDSGFSLDGLRNPVDAYGYPLLMRDEADRLGVKYVVAEYSLPQQLKNGAYQASASFRTSDLFLNGAQYAFSLESVGLQKDAFAVGDLRVHFQDDPLTLRGAARLLKGWTRTAINSFF